MSSATDEQAAAFLKAAKEYVETGHDESHDPIADAAECEVCAGALRRVCNDLMPELQMGPNGWQQLFETIRRLAKEYIARGVTV